MSEAFGAEGKVAMLQTRSSSMQFDRATAVVEAATPPLVRRRNKLLAPANWQPVDRFRRLQYSPLLHRHMTHSLQRFRGGIYVLDGALRSSDLTSDGRHEQSIDSESWHLLTLDEVGRVVTCARYYSAFQPSFDKTGAAASALAHCPKWKDKVRIGVRETMDEAKRRGMQFAELGGWCIGGALRNSPEALRTVLRMFTLAELLGGTVALSTATKRHSSSSILQSLALPNVRAG